MTAGGTDTTTRGAGKPILTFSSACAVDAAAIAAITSTSAVFFKEITFHLLKHYTTYQQVRCRLIPFQPYTGPIERKDGQLSDSDLLIIIAAMLHLPDWGRHGLLRTAASTLPDRIREERHCR
jgi:hypothetical protein